MNTAFLTALLLAGSCCGQEMSVGDPAPAENAIRQAEADLLQAFVNADTTALDRIWADEFTFTAPTGLVVPKAQYIAMMKSGAVVYDSIRANEIKVRVYGDAALASGQIAVKGNVGDHVLDGVDSYLTLYVKRDGCWQQVATLATRTPIARQ